MLSQQQAKREEMAGKCSDVCLFIQLASPEKAQQATQEVLRERLKGVRFHFLTGDINKVLLSRSSYANKFSAITVGHRHVHLVEKQHGLSRVAAPGSVLTLETVKYMLQLTGKQV